MVTRVAALLILCAFFVLGSALAVEYYFPVTTTVNISLYAAVLIIIIVLISFYLLRKTKHLSIKLVLFGITLVLLGTLMLIYGGDYSLVTYWVIGLCLISIGCIFWILGNDMAGAFDERVAALMEPIREPEEMKRMKKNSKTG